MEHGYDHGHTKGEDKKLTIFLVQASFVALAVEFLSNPQVPETLVQLRHFRL